MDVRCVMHTHARMHAHGQIYKRTEARTNGYMHARTDARTHAHTHAIARTRTYAHTHARTRTHTRRHTHARMLACMLKPIDVETMINFALPLSSLNFDIFPSRRYSIASCGVGVGLGVVVVVVVVVVLAGT